MANTSPIEWHEVAKNKPARGQVIFVSWGEGNGECLLKYTGDVFVDEHSKVVEVRPIRWRSRRVGDPDWKGE